MSHSAWVFNAKKDLLFLSGSTIFTPLVFLLYFNLGQSNNPWGLDENTVVIAIWFIFEGFFDNPHIFRTFARTHKDKTEFQRHRLFHTWGLVLLILLGMSSLLLNFNGELYFVVAVIGSWHIFKQNVGFLKVYLFKNGQPNWLRKLDLLFFYNLYFYYLSVFLFKKEVDVLHEALSPHINYLLMIENILYYSLILSFSSSLIANIYFSYKQKKIFWSKLSFLIPLTLTYLFLRMIVPLCPLMIIIVAETIYHDVQYHVWMNHFHEKRFNEKFGFFNKWFLISLCYGLFFVTIDLFIDHAEYISMIGFMIILYHYLVDGFVWKFSRQPELSGLLS